MHELVYDPVHVIVQFPKKSAPKPEHVFWKNKNYKMETVNFIHTEKEGIKKSVFFSVSNKEIFMKLKFDTESLQWFLVEYYTD